jgi:membrane protease YdiL (CAAX protease family)
MGHMHLSPLILPIASRIVDLLGVGFVIYLGSRFYHRDFRDLFRIPVDLRKNIFASILVAVVSLGFFAVNELVFSAVFSKETLHYYLRGVQSVHSLPGPKTLLHPLIITCFLSPTIEELLFTGLLYSMAKIHYPRIIAMVATSVMFSAVHLNLPFLPALFLARMFYMLFFDWSGSLMGPIIAHSLHNLAVSLLWTG